MDSEHIVKAYDEELRHLNSAIMEMGGIAEQQIATAMEAVAKRDTDLAARVVEDDDRVDELEHEVASFSVRLLALRQPMASDLRNIIAALKVSSDIERIADYAVNVAKRAIALSLTPIVTPVARIPRMGKQVQAMLKDVLDAYVERDVAKAMKVWEHDKDIDDMYDSLFRELLTYMMEDPRSITSCTHLLFIAKNIERIGDHTTNIAEDIYYLVHGQPWYKARPKGEEGIFLPPGFGPKPGGKKEAASRK
ncbi:MAG TPA: phosphate signaling complex protein PhoU [Alphaproteobacteria bacterium]|jgi:phosphate transport system protein|nr:phosphate signaling complex protein PhoU [Alphaproteobacteria bacterium]